MRGGRGRGGLVGIVVLMLLLSSFFVCGKSIARNPAQRGTILSNAYACFFPFTSLIQRSCPSTC